MEKQEFYKNARNDVTGPLAGIKVLEVTTTWAGPMAGCILADYGADVIKIEHPEGDVSRRMIPKIPKSDNLSLANETVNRNKQSLSLVISTPEGRGIFMDLAAKCDVLLENFRPGTMSKWGLGYDDIKAVKPDIVYVSISGFGQFGPLHDRVGYDPLAQAYSGWMSLNGEVGGEPVKAPTFLGDDLAGIHGAMASLAAICHKQRTGEGQHVDISLLDSLLFHSNGYPSAARIGVPLERMGNQFSFAVPANVYSCQDDYVFIGVLLESHWKLLTELIGRPGYAEDTRFADLFSRITHRDEINNILAEWCALRTVEEVVTSFAKSGIPASPINNYAMVAEDEHVNARGMLQDVELSDGNRIPLVGPVAKFSRTPVSIRTPAQPLGKQTEMILSELGIDSGSQEDLRQKGVI